MKHFRKFLSAVLSLTLIASISFPALAADKAISNELIMDAPLLSFAPDYSSVTYPTTVDGFLMRLYNLVMQRDYDTTGINYWKNRLQTGDINASNVARFFFSCNEFYSLNYSDEEYVEVLYKVFFNRSSDPTGKAYWLGKLNSGSTKRYVLEGFIASKEWADTCLKFGVVSGTTTTPSVTKVPSTQVTSFVKSLYSDCLQRTPDASGLNYWSNELTYMRKSAKDIAYGFFFSPEFKKTYNSKSPEEIVNIFYKVFLGRTPDATGSAYWASQIRAGKGLSYIYNGFINSKEFSDKCAKMGILLNMPSATPQYSQPEPVKSTPSGVVIDNTVRSYTISTSSGNKVITGYYDVQLAYEIFVLLNNYRQSMGVPALTWNDTMLQGSNVRACEIVYSFNHVRPNGSTFNTVPGGTTMRGENIAAATSATAQSFFNSWKNSAGHNANMLSTNYKTVSISVFVASESDPYAKASNMYYYGVQNFGK